MTTPDRLAAAVAQGHEDAVQVCGNCDGRKCMACVFREVHDACEETCPDCCQRSDAVQAWPQEGRDRQRRIDATPCPKCGGDRLRADFTGSGRCHAGTPAPVSPPAGEDVQERAGTAEVAEVRRAFRLDPGCHEDMGDGPCGEATVAARIDSGCGDPYPVCIEHVRAVMVPLASLLRQDPPQVAGEDVERVARVLFASHVSDYAGKTAPEIMDRCEEAARAVLASLSARPVEAQEVERLRAEAGDIIVGFTTDAIRLTLERDAALARAEAAEGVIEKVRGFADRTDSAGRVYGYAVAHDLRALLDTDSEGREV